MHYDTEMNLVMWEDDNHRSYIPAKHVHIIRRNLLKGMQWNFASPVYDITREQAAFIYANAPYTKH